MELGIYLPLVAWVCLGLVLSNKLPHLIPRLIGRSLYWIGVPLQVLAFMQRSAIDITLGIVPLIVVLSLAIGLMIALLWCRNFERAERGDFLLAALIGNTGFVGLAITPSLIDSHYLGWVVLFSLSHNIIGSYGLGVAIASYYGDHNVQVSWLTHVRNVITTPALWAFGLGLYLQLQHVQLTPWAADILKASISIVVPLALLLVGIRLKNIKNWQSLGHSIPATAIKLVLLPVVVGIGMGMVGITGNPRLAMVLQAGMPTALAGVILAEEYNLSENTIILSIALSSIGVLITIPLWLWLFPKSI